MGKKKEKTKSELIAERIRAEEERLREIYKEIEEDKQSAIDGLIPRAAFMRVTLEDYEKDINEKGSVESFSQSEKVDPYERERPVIRLYNTMNKNYQSIINQLTGLIPKQEAEVKEDGYDEFVKNRRD